MIGRVLTAVIGLAAASVLASAAFADTITVGSGPHDTLVRYLGGNFPAVGESFVAAGGTLDNFSVQVDGTGSLVTFTISAVDASTQPTTTLYSTQFDVLPGFLPVTTLSNINLNLSIGTTYFATLSAGPNALIRVGVIKVDPVDGLATTDPYPAGEFAIRDYNQGGSNGQFNYDSNLDLAFNATFDVPEPVGLSLLAVPFGLLLILRRRI